MSNIFKSDKKIINYSSVLRRQRRYQHHKVCRTHMYICGINLNCASCFVGLTSGVHCTREERWCESLLCVFSVSV